MPDHNTAPATATEVALAAIANVLAGRWVAARLGAPPWLGATVSSLGMVFAGDSTAPRMLRQVGQVVSLPGNVAINLLRSETAQATIDNITGATDAEVIDVGASSTSSDTANTGTRWAPGK